MKQHYAKVVDKSLPSEGFSIYKLTKSPYVIPELNTILLA